jgi:hypothetical protein
MSNRIFAYLRSPCPCCRELREIQRKLDAAMIVAASIEAAAGGTDVLEFWIPDASRVLKPKADDDDDVGIRLMLAVEPRLASIDEALATYAVDELRRIAADLTTAADRIESGVSL